MTDTRDICPTCGRFGAKPERVSLPPEAFGYGQLIAEARTLVDWQATHWPLLARLANALEPAIAALKAARAYLHAQHDTHEGNYPATSCIGGSRIIG